MALTAANSEPIQTAQVGGRPSADILMRRGKKKKESLPPEGTKHWSQTKAKPTADILMRRNK